MNPVQRVQGKTRFKNETFRVRFDSIKEKGKKQMHEEYERDYEYEYEQELERRVRERNRLAWQEEEADRDYAERDIENERQIN